MYCLKVGGGGRLQMKVFEAQNRTKKTPCRHTDIKKLHYVFRARHSHEAYEFVYIVSGRATHTFYPEDGGEVSESVVSKGNYFIIDTGMAHSYRNGSDDFIVINIMAKPKALCDSAEENAPFADVEKILFSHCKNSRGIGDGGIPVNTVLYDSNLSVYPLFAKCVQWKNDNLPSVHLLVRSALLETLCIISSGNRRAAKKNSLEEIKEYIDINYVNKITLSEISSKFNFSPNYICRIFKERFGLNFDEYLRQIRMTSASQLLTFTDQSVETIADIFSYSSAASFRRAFKEYYGITPGQYRKKTQNDNKA